MRFVIYDDETLEPITVVSVPGFGERDIERVGRRLVLAPLPPLNFMDNREEPRPPAFVRPKTVEIYFEQFVRRGQLSWMCFTRQAELALLLDPDWLPGQRSEINRLEEQSRALVNLFINALSR